MQHLLYSAANPMKDKAGSPYHWHMLAQKDLATHLCHKLPLLQVVSHQDRDDFAAEHKVQHGRSLGHKAPYAGTVEMDVNQVLQGNVTLHLNAQAAPEGAAGAVGHHEVSCLHCVVLALQSSNGVMLMSLGMLMPPCLPFLPVCTGPAGRESLDGQEKGLPCI